MQSLKRALERQDSKRLLKIETPHVVGNIRHFARKEKRYEQQLHIVIYSFKTCTKSAGECDELLNFNTHYPGF